MALADFWYPGYQRGSRRLRWNMLNSFLSAIPVGGRLPTLLGIVGLAFWAISERVGFGCQERSQTTQDKGTFLLISAAWYAVILVSLMDALKFRATTFAPSLTWFQNFGVPFFVAGIAARLLARRTLGREFSFTVQTTESHKLIQSGIYAYIRHPAYLGTLCLLVGLPVCFGSLSGLCIAVLVGFPLVSYRIRIEEKALREHFGEAYTEYERRTTCRIVPHLW